LAKVLSVFTAHCGRFVLLAKSRLVGPHAHPEPHILIKHDGDDIEYIVNGQSAVASRNTLVLVNALQIHGNAKLAGTCTLLAVYLDPNWLTENHPSLLVRERMFSNPCGSVDPSVRVAADRLIASMYGDHTPLEKSNHFHALDLVFRLLETYVELDPTSMAERRPADYRVRRAIALMRESTGTSTSVDAIAARTGLSRSSFYDLFHRCTGLRPKEYMDMLLMDAAFLLLKKADRPLADISAVLGFRAQSNFTRFFASQVGVTPSAYRHAMTSADALR
jgi:AraC family transcriptional regulator